MLCPPSEEHTFSPLLLTYLLRRSGRYAIFLGANVPVEKMENAILSTKPNLVIMAAQQLHSAASLLRMAQELQAMGIPVAYGGRIFNLTPGIRERIPGTFLGEALEEAPGITNRLLSHPPTQKQIEEPSLAYQEALNSFQTHLATLESGIWRKMKASGIPYTQLTNANFNLAQSIMAALTLGDISFLGNVIEWVKHLLGNLGIPKSNLNNYLSAYARTISKHLRDDGTLIFDYLFTLLNGEKDGSNTG